MAISAATPTNTPSIVKSERVLLRASDCTAMVKIIVANDQAEPLPSGGAASSCAMPAPENTGFSLGLSDSTSPSRIVTMRSVYAAMSVSCVTTTTVTPFSRLRRCNVSMISCELRVSRLPVGSSASKSPGALIKARAMATLCCWPPDN
ncbi:hypothetical protein GALL_493190 [mine drainage metagenome]|uniref:Uncharacterized protein n=1 Tax=mine drainage metagenome TaxID=410659 RepID=A0A1J5PBP2_9ZZZZ